MDISFTNEQYQALLKSVFLSAWMAQARKAGSEREEFHQIRDHLCSFAAESGAGALVEKRKGSYEPTRVLDDALRPIIEEYEDGCFWDQLIERLANRDLLAEHGADGLEKLDQDEYDSQMEERESVYEEEFNDFGLDRLQIVED